MFPMGGIGARGDGGATAPHPINLDPIVPVVADMLTEVDFRQPFKIGVDCLDSSSLVNVTLISLKSVPYVMDSSNPLIQELDNGVSSRLRYLEGGLTSMASFVHNVIFAVVFSAASLVTLGQVKVVTDQMQKHWIHTALAVAAGGVSAVGTFSPAAGIRANAGVLFGIGALTAAWAQTDLISKLGSAYQRHKQELRAAVLAAIGGNQALFNREFSPLFDVLDARFNNQVRTFADLSSVVGNIQVLPNVIPIATPAVLVHNLRRVFLNQGGASSTGGTSTTSIG